MRSSRHSLSELRSSATRGLTYEYQKLIKLNNIIEKKFQKKSKELLLEKKNKIRKILKKNAKKT